jgi:hypothetical protein
MTTVLSIDVGIKNLACCLLKREGPGFSVLSWKWYDVTQFGDSSQPGGRTAVRAARKNGGSQKVAGKCVATLRRGGKQCGKNGHVGPGGKIVCGTHDSSRKHRPEDTQQWCHHLLCALPEIAEEMNLSECDTGSLTVAIEQQTTQNRKMLLQGHVIYGFFVQYFQNRVPVKFVGAYNKLLVYGGPEVDCKLKTPYARRKFLARKHAELMLSGREENRPWLEFFASCKAKQDDVADALLQGLFVLLGRAPAAAQGTDTKRRRRRARF